MVAPVVVGRAGPVFRTGSACRPARPAHIRGDHGSEARTVLGGRPGCVRREIRQTWTGADRCGDLTSGSRGAGTGRGPPQQRRDRGPPVHLGAHGREPRLVAAPQAPATGPPGAGPPSTPADPVRTPPGPRSEEHTSELQSRENLVCRLLLE